MGSPVQSKWLPIEKLNVDYSYQRKVKDSWLVEKRQGFDASMLGVIEVSCRYDGSYWIIDGQHRVALCRMCQPPQYQVLCVVHFNLSVSEEARLFRELDATHRPLSATERWRARGAEGDQLVKSVDEVLARFDLTTGNQGKRSLSCVRVLEVIFRAGGEALLEQCLTTCTVAWDGRPDAFGGTQLHAIAIILNAYAHNGELNAGNLAVALQSISPGRLAHDAREVKGFLHVSLPRAMADVMVKICNEVYKRKRTPIPGLDYVLAGVNTVECIPLRDLRGVQNGLEI